MKKLKKIKILLKLMPASLIPLLTILDLVAKFGVDASRDFKEKKLAGSVWIAKAKNTGFPMGFLKEKTQVVKFLPLALTGGLMAQLVYLMAKGGSMMKKLSLSFVLAGSFSNLFDRFFRGYVLDYIHIRLPILEKMICNLGDIYIFLGGIGYLCFNKEVKIVKEVESGEISAENEV